MQAAAGIPEDAVEFQFLRVVVILLQQPVRRVREVERSVGLIHQVVWAVEALALLLLQVWRHGEVLWPPAQFGDWCAGRGARSRLLSATMALEPMKDPGEAQD